MVASILDLHEGPGMEQRAGEGKIVPFLSTAIHRSGLRQRKEIPRQGQRRAYPAARPCACCHHYGDTQGSGFFLVIFWAQHPQAAITAFRESLGPFGPPAGISCPPWQ